MIDIVKIFREEIEKIALEGTRPGMSSVTPQTGAPSAPPPMPIPAPGLRLPMPRTVGPIGGTGTPRPVTGGMSASLGGARSTTVQGPRM